MDDAVEALVDIKVDDDTKEASYKTKEIGTMLGKYKHEQEDKGYSRHPRNKGRPRIEELKGKTKCRPCGEQTH